jgi:hypothetical protein
MVELLLSDCMPLIHRRNADGSIEFPRENSFRACRLASPSKMMGFATLQISILGSSAVLVAVIALVLNTKSKTRLLETIREAPGAEPSPYIQPCQ